MRCMLLRDRGTIVRVGSALILTWFCPQMSHPALNKIFRFLTDVTPVLFDLGKFSRSKKLKVLLGNSSGRNDSGNSCSDDTTALPCPVARDEDTFYIRFKILIRYEVGVEEFNLRRI